MAYVLIATDNGVNKYKGNSIDTKPSGVPNGSRCFETDTHRVWVYDSSNKNPGTNTNWWPDYVDQEDFSDLLNDTVNDAQLGDIAYPISHFGGKTDDTFDNFTAIQQAFGSGKKVIFPPGIYRIKTDQTINIASNTEIIFKEGAEIMIDTGFANYMTNIPFRITSASNIKFVNFKAYGYKAPIQRLGGDGFLRIEYGSNIRFEGKTHIENANTTFLHILYSDGVFIEDFYGKQSNADGVFIRKTKNVFAIKVRVENTGDDGLSIGYDATVNSDGTGTYDLSYCCENVYIDLLEVIGKSSVFSTASGALYVCGSKNVTVNKLVCTDRTLGFRTHVGHNTGNIDTGSLCNFNINIGKIVATNLTDNVISMSGYVTDSFNSDTFKVKISIDTVLTDSCVKLLQISSMDVNVSYLPGLIEIGKMIDTGVIVSTMTIRNQKKLKIGYVYAPTCDLSINKGYNVDRFKFDDLTLRSVAIQEGCKNIDFNILTIRNALADGFLCSSSSTSYINTVTIKKLFVYGFDVNNAGKNGVETNKTILSCDYAEIYNYNTSPNASAYSILVWSNSDVTLGDVYSEWVDTVDSNRMNILSSASVICRYNQYKYKNGLNIKKSIRYKMDGITANRPTSELYLGRNYYDSTLNKPVYLKTIGTAEVETLTVSSGATTTGNITITLNGTATTVAVTSGDTTSQVAVKIRATLFSGWLVGGTDSTVIFYKQSVGTNSTPTIVDTDTTGVTGSFVVTTAGTANTWVDATGTTV